MPFFSIIIATYNRAEMLEKAVNSLLNQEFTDWELIVVDDGSIDNTHELFKNHTDSRLKYYYQENLGRSSARNRGIDLASGEYICFLDSDDYFKTHYLKILHEVLIEKDKPVCFLFSDIIFERGSNYYCVKYTSPYSNLPDYFLKNSIGAIQACIHTDILKKRKFEEELVIGEDLALWIDIIQDFPVFYFETGAVVATVHEGRSINIKNNPAAEELKTLRCILRKNHHQRFKLSPAQVRWRFSNCYSAIGFHYFYLGKRLKACIYLCKAIWKDPGHPQTRFRAHAILTVLPVIDLFFDRNKILRSINLS